MCLRANLEQKWRVTQEIWPPLAPNEGKILLFHIRIVHPCVRPLLVLFYGFAETQYKVNKHESFWNEHSFSHVFLLYFKYEGVKLEIPLNSLEVSLHLNSKYSVLVDDLR